VRGAWEWLKKAGVWIAGVLLLLLGAGWLWKRQRDALGKVRDQLAVERGLREVYRLRATREEVKKQVGEKDAAVEEIDRQLAENQRKIVEAHERGEGLSDDEVADAFARLGF